jgi:hypothetical protein
MNTAERPGYRTNGHRKTKLINQANAIMLELGAKGINLQHMLKLYGIEKADALRTTTKEWSGVIGRLKQFKKDWSL